MGVHCQGLQGGGGEGNQELNLIEYQVHFSTSGSNATECLAGLFISAIYVVLVFFCFLFFSFLQML